jgi:hypothetical protein
MKKRKSRNQVRVEYVTPNLLKTRLGLYWQPVPYGRKHKPILTSVDCLFNSDYYSESESVDHLKAM